MAIGNKKSGFTLLELSIVLVVIGLLLAMVVKGKSLIDASKIKVELSKITKIENAVSTYKTRYKRLPGFIGDNAKASPKAVKEALIKDSLLTESDLMAFDNTVYWTFIGCSDNAGKGWLPGPINKNAHLCIFLTQDEPSGNANQSSIINSRFASSLVCQIETAFDDKTVFGGFGRVVNPDTYTGSMQTSDFKCSDKAIAQDHDLGTYIYRVW